MSQRLRPRIALAAQWGVAAGLGLCLSRLPWLAALAIAPVLAGAVVAAVLAAEFTLAPLVGGPVGGRLRRSSLPAWRTEVAAHLRTFWWLQPFRDSGAISAAMPAAEALKNSNALNAAGASNRFAGPRRAILLVHGFGCTASMWLPLLESGRLDGVDVAAVDLEPDCASIDANAQRLDRAVRELAARAGAARVPVVAHSMGGLAVLACLRRYPDAPFGPIATIGTPFGGAWVARWLPCPAARQMRLDSPWRRTLAAGVESGVRGRLLCVASRDDNIVVPRHGAVLAGAGELWFEGLGHLAMASEPAVWEPVLEHVFAAAGIVIPHCDKIAV